MHTTETEVRLEEQIQFMLQMLDKATQKGCFNLSEAFQIGQIGGELIKLPESLKTIKADLNKMKEAQEAKKKLPITKN